MAKKTFVIVNWGFVHSQLEELGFIRADEGYTNYKVPEDKAHLNLWEVAQYIYESGLNVMIKHSADNDHNKFDMIAVDTKRFQQR